MALCAMLGLLLHETITGGRAELSVEGGSPRERQVQMFPLERPIREIISCLLDHVGVECGVV